MSEKSTITEKGLPMAKKEQKNQDRQHTKQMRKQICKDKATSSLFLNIVMTITSDQCTNHFQNSMCGHVHLEYINNQISNDGEFRCFPTVCQIVFALGKLTASLKPIKYIVFLNRLRCTNGI